MKLHSFETQRLLLRPMTEEDAAFQLELLNSPLWLENIGDRNVRTLEEAKIYIREKVTPQLERLGFSNFTVIRKEDGIKMGTCGLYDREGLEGVDIGFAFLPQYFGKGYAHESASKILEAGKTIFGLTEINAITTRANLASQKLIEKLGLQYIRIISLPNDPEPLLFYQWKKDVTIRNDELIN